MSKPNKKEMVTSDRLAPLSAVLPSVTGEVGPRSGPPDKEGLVIDPLVIEPDDDIPLPQGSGCLGTPPNSPAEGVRKAPAEGVPAEPKAKGKKRGPKRSLVRIARDKIALSCKEKGIHPHSSVRNHGKVDLAKVIDLKYRHKLSHKEIAAYFGVSPSMITWRIHKYMEHLPNREEVEALDSIRGDIVRGAFLKNLVALADPAKLKKASLNNVAYSAAQLHNMARLEEGKSTQNVFTADYFKYIKEQARLVGLEPKNSE